MGCAVCRNEVLSYPGIEYIGYWSETRWRGDVESSPNVAAVGGRKFGVESRFEEGFEEDMLLSNSCSGGDLEGIPIA